MHILNENYQLISNFFINLSTLLITYCNKYTILVLKS